MGCVCSSRFATRVIHQLQIIVVADDSDMLHLGLAQLRGLRANCACVTLSDTALRYCCVCTRALRAGRRSNYRREMRKLDSVVRRAGQATATSSMPRNAKVAPSKFSWGQCHFWMSALCDITKGAYAPHVTKPSSPDLVPPHVPTLQPPVFFILQLYEIQHAEGPTRHHFWQKAIKRPLEFLLFCFGQT